MSVPKINHSSLISHKAPHQLPAPCFLLVDCYQHEVFAPRLENASCGRVWLCTLSTGYSANDFCIIFENKGLLGVSDRPLSTLKIKCSFNKGLLGASDRPLSTLKIKCSFNLPVSGFLNTLSKAGLTSSRNNSLNKH